MKHKNYQETSIEEKLLGWISPKYRNEIIVGFALLFVSISIAFLVERNVPEIKAIPVVIENKMPEKTSLERKKELLDMNYFKKIASGNSAFMEKDYKLAMNEFFHAKTIYPYEFQPRYLLSQTFFTYCKEEGRYCGNAMREVGYAYAYVPEFEQKKSEELIAMDNWLKDYKRKKSEKKDDSGVHEIYGMQNVH